MLLFELEDLTWFHRSIRDMGNDTIIMEKTSAIILLRGSEDNERP
jgi:hypothetical protein